MFKFSNFYSSDYGTGRDFVAALDVFFGQLPAGWPYAIEMRNQACLQEDYFHCMAKHSVTHVFNSWTAMPTISAQVALAGSHTNPNLEAARFLLKPGRKYEKAKKAFASYAKLHEVNDDARKAGKALIAGGKAAGPKRKTFFYVNNQLEGKALETISGMLNEPT